MIILGTSFLTLAHLQVLQYHLADLPNDLIPYELEYFEKVSMGPAVNGVNILGRYRYGTEGFAVETLVTLHNMYWIRTDELNATNPMISAYRFDLENEPAFTLVQLNRSNVKAFYARTKFTPDELRKLSAVGKAEGDGSLLRQEQIGHLRELGTDWYIKKWDQKGYVFPLAQSTVGFFSTFTFVPKNYLKSVNPNGGRFLFNMSLAGVRLDSIWDPSVVPVVYESVSWKGGARCVLFADNRVRFVGPAQWELFARNLQLRLPRHGKPLPSSAGLGLLPDVLPKTSQN